MRRALSTAAILLLAGASARAHRLDEYLQGVIVSVEKGRLHAEMTLTPGVAVYSPVMAGIDTDSDGVISAAEQRAYAARVLGDLSLALNGHRLTPRLVSMEYPAVDEMREGRGEVILEFDADLPATGPNRKLTLDNQHQNKFSVYQVNCLVSRDPDIRIVAQNRNYTQSHYELEYVQSGARPARMTSAWRPVDGGFLAGLALVLFAGLAWLWRQRARGARRELRAM